MPVTYFQRIINDIATIAADHQDRADFETDQQRRTIFLSKVAAYENALRIILEHNGEVQARRIARREILGRIGRIKLSTRRINR
jgi:hypothetical protein